MCTTPTSDVTATLQQLRALQQAGADLIRIAADNKKDAAAIMQLRQQSDSTLSVDLQENYRLAELLAPHVDKIRYNPGPFIPPPTQQTMARKSRLSGGTRH